ncbi:hypothetical protein OPT61_g4861 [Boeremia exigua]|uniref:Uncharacterized protein n=1 Tax=Boeremia exigua TaxID=749465 RepID=A0ACC2ICE5_9PLEO|nr:hypothetical protein OPT61_g4861 [Boeremia exigua]
MRESQRPSPQCCGEDYGVVSDRLLERKDSVLKFDLDPEQDRKHRNDRRMLFGTQKGYKWALVADEA